MRNIDSDSFLETETDEGYEENPDGGCTITSTNGTKVMLRKSRERWLKKPLIYRMWVRAGQRYSDIRFAVKNWIQRAFRGYADYDVWSYCVNNSLRAIKLLTLLKEKRNGYPCAIAKYKEDGYTLDEDDDAPGKRWEAMLDDMIFYHMCHAEVPRKPEDCYVWHDIDISWYEARQFKDDAEKLRYKRGRYFFMRYYDSLWD